MTVSVDYQGDVALLMLGEDENRLTPDMLETVDRLLTGIEKSAGALVTIGSGKFFSNGLDLDWLASHPDRFDDYVRLASDLFARVLTFSLPTIAAVNGHAFGAGAIFALAHDYRIMRVDRGYYCFPEIDVSMGFTPGMAALIQAKSTPRTALTAMTTGHRFTGPEAVHAGLIDGTATAADLVPAAVACVAPLVGKDRATMSKIKTTMYTAVSAALHHNP